MLAASLRGSGSLRIPKVFKEIYAFSNLYEAYLKARKQKRYRKEVLEFSHNLENELIKMQDELIHRTYKVGEYRAKIVYEPKKRMIVALPFRDRIVQHALNTYIEPYFDKRMLHDSYACRAGKGTHKAAKRLGYFLGKQGLHYYLKADIKKYFASIDHDILKDIIRRTIDDEDVLWLIDTIIDSAPDTGLPIGNLMSQLFANVYLHEVDHYFKNHLGVKYYIRYMDDIVILHESKIELHKLHRVLKAFCESELKLSLNEKTRVGKTSEGVTFVGYRIWDDKKLIKKQSIDRMKKKFRAWKAGKIRDADYIASLGSWIGHSYDTASHRVVETMLYKTVHILYTRGRS